MGLRRGHLRDRVHSLGRSVEDLGVEYVVRPQAPPGDLTAEIDAWREADPPFGGHNGPRLWRG
jgi:hypothetical protein